MILKQTSLTSTYHSDIIEQAILDERICETGIVALPFLRVAVAYLAEDPGEVDAGTAAGEEEVIVELVLLGSWPTSTNETSRGALD